MHEMNILQSCLQREYAVAAAKAACRSKIKPIENGRIKEMTRVIS